MGVRPHSMQGARLGCPMGEAGSQTSPGVITGRYRLRLSDESCRDCPSGIGDAFRDSLPRWQFGGDGGIVEVQSDQFLSSQRLDATLGTRGSSAARHKVVVQTLESLKRSGTKPGFERCSMLTRPHCAYIMLLRAFGEFGALLPVMCIDRCLDSWGAEGASACR